MAEGGKKSLNLIWLLLLLGGAFLLLKRDKKATGSKKALLKKAKGGGKKGGGKKGGASKPSGASSGGTLITPTKGGDINIKVETSPPSGISSVKEKGIGKASDSMDIQEKLSKTKPDPQTETRQPHKTSPQPKTPPVASFEGQFLDFDGDEELDMFNEEY